MDGDDGEARGGNRQGRGGELWLVCKISENN